MLSGTESNRGIIFIYIIYYWLVLIGFPGTAAWIFVIIFPSCQYLGGVKIHVELFCVHKAMLYICRDVNLTPCKYMIKGKTVTINACACVLCTFNHILHCRFAVQFLVSPPFISLFRVLLNCAQFRSGSRNETGIRDFKKTKIQGGVLVRSCSVEPN